MHCPSGGLLTLRPNTDAAYKQSLCSNDFSYNLPSKLICIIQKQPPRGILKKMCSENTQQIYMKTPMLKCDFNKVALQINFTEITLQHGCSPVTLLHIFRTPFLKGTLSGLGQFLATESPLKMVKNTFYFPSKALFILKMFKFLSWLFVHVPKQLDQKDKVNFKFCDITAWLTNNRDTHIAQYFEK